MDWDLKNQPWNLPVLENHRHKEKRVGNVVRGLDLKLGASRDLLGSPHNGQGGGPFPLVPTPERGNHNSTINDNSLKRARAIQKATCLVDGCKADLSSCREYHRRHKVCEMHSKTPTVLVGGTEKRFCQQCSRFHLLVEFDEVKRSCRKRLDGHNRRRRKPQPDPFNSGSLFPVHQAEGSRYSFPCIFTAPTSDPSWNAVVNNGESVMSKNKSSFHLFERQRHSPPNSTFQICKEGKGFPFVCDDDTAICSRANVASSSSNGATSSSKSCSKKISNGLPEILNADCALSLLSSPLHGSTINLGHVAPAEGVPFGRPQAQQVSNQRRYIQPHSPNIVSSSSGLSCSGIEAEQIGNILVADSSDDADLNCHNLYSLGDSVALDGHSQALPFSW